MTPRLTILVNLDDRVSLNEFRLHSRTAPNILGIHLNDPVFLRMGGIDAQYMSLTAAERWGSKPIVPLSVALLRTSAADQEEGWPPYILTGMVLRDEDPDTPAFVIPALAEAIANSSAPELSDGRIRTIGLSERSLRWGGTSVANVAELMAAAFGRFGR